MKQTVLRGVTSILSVVPPIEASVEYRDANQVFVRYYLGPRGHPLTIVINDHRQEPLDWFLHREGPLCSEDLAVIRSVAFLKINAEENRFHINLFPLLVSSRRRSDVAPLRVFWTILPADDTKVIENCSRFSTVCRFKSLGETDRLAIFAVLDAAGTIIISSQKEGHKIKIRR